MQSVYIDGWIEKCPLPLTCASLAPCTSARTYAYVIYGSAAMPIEDTAATTRHVAGRERLDSLQDSALSLRTGILSAKGCFLTAVKVSVKVARWSPAGEGPFAESCGSPSRWMCAERWQLLSAKVVFEKEKAQRPPRPPPPCHRGPHCLAAAAARHLCPAHTRTHIHRPPVHATTT
jgi:hypothetical protein